MAKGKKKSSKKDEGQSQESEEDMSGASESESEEDTDESEESSSSSDDEEEDSDVKVDDHGPPTSTDALEEFYGNRKRVDAKEVSCVLHNKTLGLYFKTMLGLGRLDKDGWDHLVRKYFLSPRQFNRLAPPTLEGTRLHVMNDMEFGGLSEKLLKIHREHRCTAKLLLRFYEILGTCDKAFSSYVGTETHSSPPDNIGPLPEYTIPSSRSFIDMDTEERTKEVGKLLELLENPSNIRAFANELVARRSMTKHLTDMYNRLLEEKYVDHQIALLGKKVHTQGTDLLWDLLTMVGQEDLTIKEVREAKLSHLLTPSFQSALKSSGKSFQAKRKKDCKDKLFHHDIESLVTRETKAAKLNKVLKKQRTGGSRTRKRKSTQGEEDSEEGSPPRKPKFSVLGESNC